MPLYFTGQCLICILTKLVQSYCFVDTNGAIRHIKLSMLCLLFTKLHTSVMTKHNE